MSGSVHGPSSWRRPGSSKRFPGFRPAPEWRWWGWIPACAGKTIGGRNIAKSCRR